MTCWEGCGWIWLGRGEDWGEPEEREPSVEEELMDSYCAEVLRSATALKGAELGQSLMIDCFEICKLTSSSVNRARQYSQSSSKSKDLAASYLARAAVIFGLSVKSLILLTPLNCRCEFCEADKRGALRERPL